MYSGTSILLVTNNESTFGVLNPEIIDFRIINKFIVKSYQDAVAAIQNEQPQIILLN